MTRMSRKSGRASSEHDEQVKLFNWAKGKEVEDSRLENMFAIPNVSYGGTRADMLRGRKLKAEGRKAGVLDIFLAVTTEEYPGLFIEMKYGSNKPSDVQKEWIDRLKGQGYRVEVCYSGDAAIELVKDYLQI